MQNYHKILIQFVELFGNSSETVCRRFMNRVVNWQFRIYMCRMKLIDGKRTQARVQRAVVVPHLQVLHRNVQAIKENSVFFLVFNSTWHYHIAYCHLFISIFSSSSFSSTPPYTLFYVINWRFDNKWRASKLLNSCNLISFAARRRRWNRKPKKKNRKHIRLLSHLSIHGEHTTKPMRIHNRFYSKSRSSFVCKWTLDGFFSFHYLFPTK